MPAANDEVCLDVYRTRPILDEIANKWSVLVLTVLCSQPARFNVLKQRLEGITHKALADTLKRLERNGLVERHVLADTVPVGVLYNITPLGHSLRKPFEALYAWAMEHGPTLQQAQAKHDRRKSHLQVRKSTSQ